MQKPIKDLLNFSIINLDKPSGPTSFQVSQYVKNLFKISKTSHFGTLDPMVTGVLPVALGRACRLNEYFMHSDKVYVGIMRLHKDIDDKTLNEQMNKFIGIINQLPPVRSRVKRALREREIKRFEIIERDGKDVLFFSEVQAGTYIRKLCDDLGKEIGGAHMLELRRTRASVFEEKDSINLYGLDKAYKEYNEGKEEKLRSILIPAEEAIKKVLPVIEIKADEKLLKQLLTGKPIMKNDLSIIPNEEVFTLFTKDRFIGVYHKSQEGDIIARPEFIFN